MQIYVLFSFIVLILIIFYDISSEDMRKDKMYEL
jgi:hypothetical protein